MTRDQAKARLRVLRRYGFDQSRGFRDPDSGNHGIRLGCSQCQALYINSIACHETGCPNQRRSRRGR